MARQCPDDGGDLEQVTIEGIQIDLCHTCGGIWLDKGEIARVRQLNEADAQKIELPIERMPARQSNPTCPLCHKPLQPFKYYGGNANLETCPDLDGIWVPEEELKKILAARTIPDAAMKALAEAEADSQDREMRYNNAAGVLQVLDRFVGWATIPTSHW